MLLGWAVNVMATCTFVKVIETIFRFIYYGNDNLDYLNVNIGRAAIVFL